jgi:tetratricopeptide (TPR) repeat protein
MGRASNAQFRQVGAIDFPTSGSPEAQQHFLRGVSILHSFGWKQAIEQFQEAQRLDPDFAMAYWGETLCYNHPLFGNPPDDDNPRAVLRRLGATPDARLAKAPTDREKGFLGAVEVLWGEGDYDDRRVAYMEAMGRLHERYPDDDEVATFYAVSTLSASRALGDQTFRLEMRAGAVALGVFGSNPDHPGAPHYAIHAFDDPTHAPLALPAALRYAEIAPAVAHARHMPTHIFIQHGMWDLVSSHNQTAYEAARALWQPGDSVGDTVHPLDWGQYGDLQRGDYAKARTWIERLEMVAEESDGATRARNSLPLVRARYVVETEEWKMFPISEDTSGPELLATALSAVRTGDTTAAERAVVALESQAGDGGQAGIMHKEAAAMVRLAKGDGAGATQLMDEAVAIAQGLRPPNGAASPIKPPYELYGEMLLELDRPEEALAKFQTSLRRMPKRARSVLGAARAADQSGDRVVAGEHYATLLDIWRDHPDVPGFAEAQRFVEDMK